MQHQTSSEISKLKRAFKDNFFGHQPLSTELIIIWSRHRIIDINNNMY